ncbi:MAG: hypothetical protein JNL32_09505 [Candidatus Kapabacteria bacterium]|nr:hypothetical protein [Candidatus Kapabacteria bacterium]
METTYSFSETDVLQIASTLLTEAKSIGDSWYMQCKNTNNQSLAITLHNNILIDGKETVGTVITAQTQHGYFEIHHCVGFVVVEPDEVIFISHHNDNVSSLVVGSQCTCSLFANINRAIFSSDFATLDPSVLMAAMQLSLTEQVLP